MKKLKVGITGGIGGGKSTVSSIIRKLGFEVIDADNLAREIMHNEVSVKEALIEEFGPDTYSNGNLNTTYLRERVFSKKEELSKLNSIVHPITIDKIREQAEQYSGDKDLVFVESALVFESKMDKMLDLVVLVLADEEIRIQRVMDRDGIPESTIREIMESQLSDNTKKGRSDFILMNNGEVADLEENIRFFIKLFRTLGKSGDINRLKMEEPEEEE